MSATTVRPATEADRPTIRDIVRAAFTGDGRDGQEEVDIVDTTWGRGEAGKPVDLVAVDGDRIVGHVLGARAEVGGRRAIGLAPLAVVPDRHGQGIGGALVTEFIRRCEAAGWPLIGLLGSPEYYERFGFEPAGPLGIIYPPVGAGSPHFQVHRLAAYDGSYRGTFAYCWELPS